MLKIPSQKKPLEKTIRLQTLFAKITEGAKFLKGGIVPANMVATWTNTALFFTQRTEQKREDLENWVKIAIELGSATEKFIGHEHFDFLKLGVMEILGKRSSNLDAVSLTALERTFAKKDPIYAEASKLLVNAVFISCICELVSAQEITIPGAARGKQ